MLLLMNIFMFALQILFNIYHFYYIINLLLLILILKLQSLLFKPLSDLLNMYFVYLFSVFFKQIKLTSLVLKLYHTEGALLRIERKSFLSTAPSLSVLLASKIISFNSSSLIVSPNSLAILFKSWNSMNGLFYEKRINAFSSSSD